MSIKNKIIGLAFKAIKAFRKTVEWFKGPIIEQDYADFYTERAKRKRKRKQTLRVLNSDHRRRSTDFKG